MLIETPREIVLTDDAGEPPEALAAELAWCLRRFVTGRADEGALRRAEQALAAWDAWSARARSI